MTGVSHLDDVGPKSIKLCCEKIYDMTMENLVLQKHIPLITPPSEGKKTGYRILDIVEYHNKEMSVSLCFVSEVPELKSLQVNFLNSVFKTLYFVFSFK